MFMWSEFISRNNSELLANLGNFVNRVVKFITAKYNSTIPASATIPETKELITDTNGLLEQYVERMETVHLRMGLRIAMSISARGNRFLQDNKVDNRLFADHPEKCAAILAASANLVYLLSACISPFMPGTSAGILRQLNAEERVIPDSTDLNELQAGHVLNQPEYLFKRIEAEKEAEWKAEFG